MMHKVDIKRWIFLVQEAIWGGGDLHKYSLRALGFKPLPTWIEVKELNQLSYTWRPKMKILNKK